MIVKHNLQAMNSNRMLGVNSSTLAKSTEKLSSGYKINRAADDAAGLSISEKMRRQIRGLSQASLNAQDGISAVQTAEGALNEVQDMLQRANELAVKAANGTMSETDRGYIQNEIDQLVTEIDRVSTTTKFNETYLLKGDAKKATLESDTDVTVDGLTKTLAEGSEVTAGDEILLGTVVEDATKKEVTSTDAGGNSVLSVTGTAASSITNGTYTYKAAGTDTYALATNTKLYKATYNGNTFDIVEVTGDEAIKQAYDDINGTSEMDTNYGTLTAATANGKYTYFTSTADPGSSLADSGAITGLTDYAAGAAAHVTKTTGAAAGWYADGASTETALTGLTISNVEAGDTITISSGKKLELADDVTGDYSGDLSDYEIGDEVNAYATVDVATDGTKTVGASATEPENSDPLVLKLHVGADSTEDNQISVSIDSMSAKGLGLLDEDGKLLVNGEDDTNALAAIDTIAAALQQVSTQRSALGAVQNRLEHTIANLDNVVENTTSAEAQIRDTDMATEMVKYSNNNILAQAGQAMLAQANQANQGVLSLLG
uniref:flagellin N-terminal helical domain-containing protein n=2 Tax=Acetatifactor sp. TaxID=1872090 RepID=UPI004056B323